jgi:hypothetical protein
MIAAWPMNARVSPKLIAMSMRPKPVSIDSGNSSKSYAKVAMIQSWRDRCFAP